MAAVVIGSKAIERHFPGELGREPRDLDLILSSNTRDGSDGDVFSNPALDDWIGPTNRIATVDELYTIKLSHSYWELKNGSWDKHVFDLRFLKRRGGKLIPDLHDTLYKVWIKIHGSKRTNLAMEKGQFFKDAVVRIYDHDSIHDSVAYGDAPLYNSILKDGSTVDVDSKKMWALPQDQLVLLFREEVCATALERIVIPQNYRGSPGAAYRWALRRTVTSLTKGRSATYILDNFEDFATPDDYLSRHLAKKDKLVKL